MISKCKSQPVPDRPPAPYQPPPRRGDARQGRPGGQGREPVRGQLRLLSSLPVAPTWPAFTLRVGSLKEPAPACALLGGTPTPLVGAALCMDPYE